MKQLFITMIVCMMATVSGFTQYTTNYYNQYGSSTGSARTRSDIGGGYTTNYYDQYGSSIGSSTTRSNIGGGTTTTYYNAYGSNIGTIYDW